MRHREPGGLDDVSLVLALVGLALSGLAILLILWKLA